MQGLGPGLGMGDHMRQEKPATIARLGRVPETNRGKPGSRPPLTPRHRQGLEQAGLEEEVPECRGRALGRADPVPTAGVLPAVAFRPAQ
jgi:hypothetical protein